MSPLAPIAGNLLVAALVAAAARAACARLLARHPDLRVENALARVPALWALIPLSVLVLAANVAAIAVRKARPAVYWSFPLWLDYSVMLIQWCLLTGIFAFTFGFASTLALRTGHRERRSVVLASVLLVAAVQLTQWSCTRSVVGQLGNEISASGMVSQTSPVSCAAASGATILRNLGMTATERQMAELYGTSILGSSAAQVVYGNALVGVASRKVEVPDRDPAKLAAPAMLFVDNPFAGPESHAVAYLGVEQGKAVIWDPLTGLGRYEPGRVARFWRGRGIKFERSDAK